MNKQLPPNQIRVPDLEALARQQSKESQQTELQLRIVALSEAVKVAEHGEDLNTTLERIENFKDYLFKGTTRAE